jgi:hypothetical protein
VCCPMLGRTIVSFSPQVKEHRLAHTRDHCVIVDRARKSASRTCGGV